MKRPFVRSAMDIWGGLPGASQLTPQDHESIKEDPGVYRVYPKVRSKIPQKNRNTLLEVISLPLTIEPSFVCILSLDYRISDTM